MAQRSLFESSRSFRCGARTRHATRGVGQRERFPPTIGRTIVPITAGAALAPKSRMSTADQTAAEPRGSHDIDLLFPPAMNLRPPRWLLVLVALVQFGQSALAVAHCLRLAATPQPTALHVEICTADGIVLMDLGGADQDAPAGHDHAGFCLACHGVPQMVMSEPVGVPLRAEGVVAAEPIAREMVLDLGARAPPYSTRAPPALS